jgi:hypothetical protein
MNSQGEWLRLQRLGQLVKNEVQHLQKTDARLFGLSAEALAAVITSDEVAERVDAFVARFGRLQDNLVDKLLPALLAYLQEPPRPVMENLMVAEKLGWLDSVDDWLLARKLRNQLIHDYEDDTPALLNILYEAHQHVPLLTRMADQLILKLASLPAGTTL